MESPHTVSQLFPKTRNIPSPRATFNASFYPDFPGHQPPSDSAKLPLERPRPSTPWRANETPGQERPGPPTRCSERASEIPRNSGSPSELPDSTSPKANEHSVTRPYPRLTHTPPPALLEFAPPQAWHLGDRQRHAGCAQVVGGDRGGAERSQFGLQQPLAEALVKEASGRRKSGQWGRGAAQPRRLHRHRDFHPAPRVAVPLRAQPPIYSEPCAGPSEGWPGTLGPWPDSAIRRALFRNPNNDFAIY
ncbi:hypothetical protein AAY473_019962 [Plecturocebus cupreus]